MRSLLRVFNQQPLAAKVPEVTALFWVIKISTTAAGEAISDMFVSNKKLGVVVEVSMFCVALVLAVRVPALLRRHLLVPGAGHRDRRDGSRRHHAPRLRHAVRRDVALLGAGPRCGLLPLEPERAHARHPLHHDQPAGEVLLVRRLRHLRPRHGGRRLRRHHARPGLPGLGPLVLRRDPDPVGRLEVPQVEQHLLPSGSPT